MDPVSRLGPRIAEGSHTLRGAWFMSVIFLIGANGFIGRRVGRALEERGHKVIRGLRPQVDLARADAVHWPEQLRGADVVINAAGIFRQTGGQSFEAVQVRGPRALFEACATLGLSVIQVSALGADEQASSAFHRTKKQADDFLIALDIPSVVLQPSLVYGAGGESARLFSALASMPLIPLPGDGGQEIQPVHVDDLCAAVVAIVERDYFPRTRLPIVGPAPTTLRAFLGDLRQAMSLGAPRFVNTPMVAVRSFARLGSRLDLMLDEDALGMLRRGNTGDARPLADLLGRAPRPAAEFVDPMSADAARAAARLTWLLPILRVSIAMVWIIAGVVSLGLYPVEESLALLARSHLTGAVAYVALYGAAALDLVLGVATLVVRNRALWLAQIAVIVGYSAIITLALPELWLHPFGPVAKNLPLLAALLLLYYLDER
jgi:uncharacterized protein YbjT (DUF2867 family)